MQNPQSIPLVVDLDGTLLRGDTLHEVVFSSLFQAPGNLLGGIGALLRGDKAAFKSALSPRFADAAASLPARQEVLDLIESHRADGGMTILATGAHESIANSVATRFGCFDGIFSTRDAGSNFVGENKRDELVRRFSEGGYDYVGDSKTDLPVWRSARKAYVAGRLTDNALAKAGRDVERLVCPEKPPKSWKAIRPHQWVKNILVFLPMLTAHRLTDAHTLSKSFLAFVAFCAAASFVYLVNDLSDRPADRLHATKRRRPIAWGALGPLHALVAAAGMLGLLVAICSQLPILSGGAILLYIVVNLAYSFVLKRRLLVDVFLLAWMYVWRVIAGGAATDIHLTSWLLGFSGFTFLSLAFAKRYAEVVRLEAKGKESAKGRAWRQEDAPALLSAGIASSVGGSLVLALYVNGDSFTKLYRNPTIALLLAPLFLYWSMRLWIQALRKELHEDPIMFAAKDKVSYLTGAVAVAILAAAML